MRSPLEADLPFSRIASESCFAASRNTDSLPEPAKEAAEEKNSPRLARIAERFAVDLLVFGIVSCHRDREL